MNSVARRLAAVPVLLLAGLATPPAAVAGSPARPAPAGSTAVLTPAGAGPAALERMRREIATSTGAAAVPCWREATIRSAANGRYVSAEIGFAGADHAALRASAVTPGKWERFIVCRDPATGVTRIRAQANAQFVSAELDYAGARYGLLRAQADRVGGWERFYSNAAPGGQFSFYARDTKRWVAAEVTFTGNQYGVLRARAINVGAEETFSW